ncbi:hypothetical protein [Nocardia seriolae]|uniref:Uncharacterized protein n=1 Tax=Nocardia seriolae TaxID=37332 RepID=A0ABC9Z0N2_9NOCA|nr:hypothetical protein [Nocardia seriolae]GEM23983.1 hypothetical protein NS2_22220 [Nocardia seriolae NBRC 15557]APB01543.1 hypothetical protein NS506_07523 [Nocardia seriolae]OJF78380.1 hypothetical protein NS14008_03015 [Nocardia seriolae]PSK30615.1 hypothetical protein C6575_14655 [Nocardia seriolae]QOW31397.1 hypothetical protein IMZ23_25280 [Nocardia seriolae]
MFHERNACHFCGRFVLEAEGWAESIPPYHTILATWDDESTVFNGSFHLGCVRNFERRGEFRQAIVDWLTTTNRLITVHDEDGQPHEISATGLGYTNKIAKLSDGEIYEDPRFNRWVFIEAAGPYHFLELEAAEALRAGQRVRGDGGGTSAVLPTEPAANIESWSLPELLGFLEIRDLYQELLDTLEPQYRFWEGGPGRAGYILTYSLSAVRPIPIGVGAFFDRYLQSYAPKRLEDA